MSMSWVPLAIEFGKEYDKSLRGEGMGPGLGSVNPSSPSTTGTFRPATPTMDITPKLPIAPPAAAPEGGPVAAPKEAPGMIPMLPPPGQLPVAPPPTDTLPTQPSGGRLPVQMPSPDYQAASGAPPGGFLY